MLAKDAGKITTFTHDWQEHKLIWLLGGSVGRCLTQPKQNYHWTQHIPKNKPRGLLLNTPDLHTHVYGLTIYKSQNIKYKMSQGFILTHVIKANEVYYKKWVLLRHREKWNYSLLKNGNNWTLSHYVNSDKYFFLTFGS